MSILKIYRRVYEHEQEKNRTVVEVGFGEKFDVPSGYRLKSEDVFAVSTDFVISAVIIASIVLSVVIW